MESLCTKFCGDISVTSHHIIITIQLHKKAYLLHIFTSRPSSKNPNVALWPSSKNPKVASFN